MTRKSSAWMLAYGKDSNTCDAGGWTVARYCGEWVVIGLTI